MVTPPVALFSSKRRPGPESRAPRRGLNHVELLVALCVSICLAGLLLPAVLNSWEAANQAECKKRLEQIGLALQASNDAQGLMPPAIGYYPQEGNQAYGTVWLHLLPYVEQGTLYKQAVGPDGYVLPSIAATPVKLFQCPSDPSLGTGVLTTRAGTPYGASSYAANAQVFCTVYPSDSLWAGWYLDAAGQPSLAKTFSDGTANTILVAEKYSWCNNLAFLEGGTAWAYWYTTQPDTKPYHATFSQTWTTYDIGPGSHFLVQPSPSAGPESTCDPTLAATGHGSGMPVLLADGSVRTLAPDISGSTWWAACTPNAGDSLGPDW